MTDQLASALCLTLASANATPQTGIARVVGSYVATQLSGSQVVRLELSLKRDGSARLRTGSSRYSQRPQGVDAAPVVETGTWHLRDGRVVLHIETATGASTNAATDKPRFAERTFVLAGCVLQLLGSAFAFDKQHCM